MSFFDVFFIFTSEFLFLWSVFELSGRKKLFFMPMLVVLLVSFVFSKIFFSFLLLQLGLRAAFLKKNKSYRQDLIRICDEIILELKVGRSFTSVAKEKVEKNQQLKMLLLKTNNLETKQFNQVISFCLQYPSLAYKVIFAFRNKIFLSNKLKEKQKTVLVQPRAQGVVSAALYFGIFLFQLYFHPGFLDVFHVGLGRKLMVLSFFLLLSGLYVVFFYFKPKESHFL